ncbi:MAG: hypothetical protein ABSB94_16560 [Syntrophorhabdales bacterium]
MKTLEYLVEFDHLQQYIALVLLLDTSGAMAGTKIRALEEGLRVFKEALTRHDRAAKRVDLAVVTFDDDVRVIHDFASVERFDPPTLVGSGQACMGDAILKAVEMVETRKRQYRENGVDYYRPIILLVMTSYNSKAH